jgi:L-amino acid N-acyltransferase YncA
MTTSDNGLRVRRATPEDAVALCEILNEIIALGGTTALETQHTPAELDEHYISGPECIFCHMAETADGTALGFQTLLRSPDLPGDWGDIGTFTRRSPRVPGVGTALFEQTKKAARDRGLSVINATIRADNYSGIPFYEKMGFRTYDIAKAVPLKDGTPVDRVLKRYSLDQA